MIEDAMNDARTRDTDPFLPLDIRPYRAGEPGAADRLTAALQGPVARDVARFLGDDHADCDDVVQDTLLATLQYLDRDTEFSGDLVRLAVTIARNRCRDLARWHRRRPRVDPDSLADWLADPRRSVLDEIEHTQLMALLQSALGRLSADCRDLLRAMYLEGLATETVRARLGLGTVQGVYYRRSVCLRQVKSFLSRRLHGRSGPGSEGRNAP